MTMQITKVLVIMSGCSESGKDGVDDNANN